MANTHLQQSTLICGCIHLLGICIFNPPVAYTCHLLTGLSLSLANHTFTSEPIKWLDRAYMVVGIPITYYAAPYCLQWSPLLPAFIYLVSKYSGSVYGHSYAHYTLTVIHMLILYLRAPV